jgi:hypothetical protein
VSLLLLLLLLLLPWSWVQAPQEVRLSGLQSGKLWKKKSI